MASIKLMSTGLIAIVAAVGVVYWYQTAEPGPSGVADDDRPDVVADEKQIAPASVENRQRNPFSPGSDKFESTGGEQVAFALDDTPSSMPGQSDPFDGLPEGEPEIEISSEAISLWQAAQDNASQDGVLSDVNAQPVRLMPGALDAVQVGQSMVFHVPQENLDYEGVIETTHNMLDGEAMVWSGTLSDGGDYAQFTITRNTGGTDVMLATGTNVYHIELNNHTGYGSVIDDRELYRFRQGVDTLVPESDAAPLVAN
ncbi:MAG: hypothetical protein ABW162_14160 [Candidatus Sedimenticola sp. PURPLELP]